MRAMRMRCDDAIAALAVEVCDGAKGDGLSRTGRAEAHRDRGVGAGEVVDGFALLGADDVAGPHEGVEAALDGFAGDRVAAREERSGSELLYRTLFGRVVERRVQPSVREAGAGVGGAPLALLVESDDGAVFEEAGEHGAQPGGVDEAGAFSGDVLDELGDGEYRLADGEAGGDLAAPIESGAHLGFVGTGDSRAEELLDKGAGVDVELRFLVKPRVAVGGIGGVLARPCSEGDLLGEGGALSRVDAELSRGDFDAFAPG